MRRRFFALPSRHIHYGLWIAFCASFADGIAAEPVRADLPPRTGDAQQMSPELLSGGAPLSAAPGELAQGATRYAAAFFTEFQPTTALDMVKRLPGFTFEPGDTTIRGFAGALGNVLIDGRRPASKAVLLEDVLRRIPVSGVAAIEVIRGGAPGINMQGQPVVANIVRVGGDSSAYVAQVTGIFATEYDPGLGLRLESTRSSGPLVLDGALNFRDEQQYGNTGTGAQVRRDRNGELIEASRFETDWTKRQLQANGSAEYQTDVGLLRVAVGGTNEDTKQLDIVRPRDDLPHSSSGRVVTDIRLDQGEAGIDYEHNFSNDVSGRVLLLQTLEKKIISADAIGPQAVQRSEDEALRGESILRSSATYITSPWLSVEAGLEAAYNFLDVDASLHRNGAAVPLPAARVKVEEERGEVFLDARWKHTPRLASDLGLRYEQSTISQSGDSDARRTLSYLKPRAMLTLDLDRDIQLRGRVQRTVSQLEFRDFASQATLDAGTISSGNADLHPESAWEFEGAIEKRFLDSGTVALTYTHSLVSDVVDIVPVAGFDTPGNIGDGTRDKIALSLSLPMELLGIPGSLLRINSRWTSSEVDDPVTHESRRISKDPAVNGDVVLTKEFPGLASTLSLENSMSKRETSYRFSEVRTDHWDHFLRLYWDWTPKDDVAVRVLFSNFTGRPRSRWRTVYEGSRASELIAFHEDRHIDALRSIEVQVRRTF